MFTLYNGHLESPEPRFACQYWTSCETLFVNVPTYHASLIYRSTCLIAARWGPISNTYSQAWHSAPIRAFLIGRRALQKKRALNLTSLTFCHHLNSLLSPQSLILGAIPLPTRLCTPFGDIFAACSAEWNQKHSYNNGEEHNIHVLRSNSSDSLISLAVGLTMKAWQL